MIIVRLARLALATPFLAAACIAIALFRIIGGRDIDDVVGNVKSRR